MDKKIAHEFIKLCSSSKHYASYTDADVVEAGSVGCGHWNQFLACIIDKAQVPEPFVAKLCESGRQHLDGDRLCRDQPALRQLIDHGLQFTVIKHSKEIEYPQLPNILQKALNVEHHIGEGHENQTICRYVISLFFCPHRISHNSHVCPHRSSIFFSKFDSEYLHVQYISTHMPICL